MTNISPTLVATRSAGEVRFAARVLIALSAVSACALLSASVGAKSINDNIARFADGERIRYININDKLADANGVLFDGMTLDKLHPTVKGYQLWADALKPVLTELLGPPATTDQAPPPTGDPSALRP